MITPADDFDDGPDLDPDDPLTVILRPPAGHLGPPPGRYQEIRRGAVRRRALRTAAGVGAACAVTVLAVLLPLRLTHSDAPARPGVPLAPPPATGPPSTVSTPSPSSPEAADPPTRGADTGRAPETPTPVARTGAAAPDTDHTVGPGPTPSPQDTRSAQRSEPSIAPSASKARR
ncbi:hypothetical protein [Streptomyces sp. NPDC058291]|uniref:hypothetical protein n=1 Tax=Streptomyces sp. NPDC058291 TaxID=3346427 RepID=UPI0036EC24B0